MVYISGYADDCKGQSDMRICIHLRNAMRRVFSAERSPHKVIVPTSVGDHAHTRSILW